MISAYIYIAIMSITTFVADHPKVVVVAAGVVVAAAIAIACC